MTLLTQVQLNYALIGISLGALLTALLCAAALRRCLRRFGLHQQQMQAEVRRVIERCDANLTACTDEAEQSSQPSRVRVQELAAPPAGIGRTDRSRAMQLLRSGLTPATVASSLNLELNEVHLIGAVSKALQLQGIGRDASHLR